MGGFGSLFSWLGGIIAGLGVREGAIQLAKFVATKIIITTVFVLGLSILLNNFLIDWITDYLMASSQYITDPNLQSAVINISGLAAYIGGLLQIKECFSIIIAGLSVGMIRKAIPFL